MRAPHHGGFAVKGQKRIKSREELERVYYESEHWVWQYRMAQLAWGIRHPWMAPSVEDLCRLLVVVAEKRTLAMLPPAPASLSMYSAADLAVARHAAVGMRCRAIGTRRPPGGFTQAEEKALEFD